MSFDRRYVPCLRLISALIFLSVLTPSAQADDTWHNVYHSLKRFFTGKPSSTPVVHHRRRRTDDDEKTNPSTEHSSSPAENAPSPGASATPRVVILPASPASEATPGTENPARGPGSAEKAEPSPGASAKPSPSSDLGPVLRSLSEPTPTSNPGVLPTPAPTGGSTATN
jgi:hypothetical protein